LSIYVTSATHPTWKDILNSFKKTKLDLKSARILRMLYRPNIFKSFELAYRGILWKELSIDLVAASLRQREFARKITSEGCNGIDTPFALSNATTRYHKFLLLMKREVGGEKKQIALVPTLDIDLCWHTHQLASVSYREWCVKHLGVAINHDDTVAKDKLDSGLHETNAAWLSTYRESYSTNKPSAVQPSKDSKVRSIFPFKKEKAQTSSPVQNSMIKLLKYANNRVIDGKWRKW
jgi:Glycine-rich domain-containing protein-like